MLKRLARSVLPARIWTTLRRIRRRWELRTFRVRVERHAYGGVELEVLLADPIAEAWYSFDWEPLPEIELLRSGRLRPGSLVFNLGAHQAVVALLLADAVGADGTVVAVEATGHNAEVAAENRRLNDAQNLVVVHAAASDTTGRVRFAEYLDGFIDEKQGSAIVEAVTVDELASRYGLPDVVFVDVEGAEARVLAGARQTLARARTDWYVEIHAGLGLERLGGTRDDVFAPFTQDEYDVYVSFEHNGEYMRYAGEPELYRAAHALVALAKSP